ncbi:parvalbumin beta-like [Dendrobates tinctorius]|uniref:parvalbumin beta-like n=1 Tax=Dendrobates tinctorius TaxID=92724 RepID=UPI003CC9D208
MSVTGIFSQNEIEKGLSFLLEDISFKTNVFFQKVNLTNMSEAQITKVFNILDRDNDGILLEEEVSLILQNFRPGARRLTPAETADFMKAGDPNNTGKISLAGFIAMVKASKPQG